MPSGPSYFRHDESYCDVKNFLFELSSFQVKGRNLRQVPNIEQVTVVCVSTGKSFYNQNKSKYFPSTFETPATYV